VILADGPGSGQRRTISYFAPSRSSCDFVLVESQLEREGAKYEIVRRWPLPGPSARITES